MIKIFFVLLCTLFTQNLFAQNNFQIKGTTPPHMNGTKIYLSIWDYYSDVRFTHRDSAVIKNNKFSFAGRIPKIAEQATLSSKNGGFSFI
ncbi:MAG TPA: DUF4369 domain-containing protein [Sphingobacteriaceae bacterium]